jgi:hypothetical protein
MSDDLQFEEAEFDAPPQLPTDCAACSAPLGNAFWVEDRRYALCQGCKTEREAAAQGFDPVGLAKAAVFGGAAALAGGLGWGIITAVTGYNIGLIAIAAGWLVAMGVLLGAGRGGLIHQLLAVGLTYVAICFNEVVIFAWLGVTEEGLSLLEAVGYSLVALPISLVMLVPATIEAGGFISLLIFGFALFQAFQMTAGRAPVHEGPFPTTA